MAITGTCATVPTPRHQQASLTIQPGPEEISASFSQQSGQGATSNVMELASEVNLFSMPGLEHILEG